MTAALGGAQAQRFTVGIGCISHESNSFNPSKTTMADVAVRIDYGDTIVWYGPGTGTRHQLQGSFGVGVWF